MKSVMRLGVVGGFVLVLAATMPAAAARKPGGVAQAQAGRAMSGSVVVDMRKELLTVRAHDVPLAEVLQAVAARAGVRVLIKRGAGSPSKTASTARHRQTLRRGSGREGARAGSVAL